MSSLQAALPLHYEPKDSTCVKNDGISFFTRVQPYPLALQLHNRLVVVTTLLRLLLTSLSNL